MVKSTGINTGPSSPFDHIWHEVYQMDEVLSNSISHFTFHFPPYSKFLWICDDIMKAYGESQIRNFYNICDPLSVALTSFPGWAKWILTYSLWWCESLFLGGTFNLAWFWILLLVILYPSPAVASDPHATPRHCVEQEWLCFLSSRAYFLSNNEISPLQCHDIVQLGFEEGEWNPRDTKKSKGSLKPRPSAFSVKS